MELEQLLRVNVILHNTQLMVMVSLHCVVLLYWRKRFLDFTDVLVVCRCQGAGSGEAAVVLQAGSH